MIRRKTAIIAQPSNSCSHFRRSQSGFTLIEILVTVFVFSIGLLGVASLQAVSKKANFDATQRTIANTLAADIITRMRANSSVVSSYITTDVSTVVPDVPNPDCQAAGTTCTPGELAAYDLWSWDQAIEGDTTTSGGNSAGGAG